MNRRLVAAILPFYLLACLLLGGSAQAIYGNFLLQLAGLAIIVWAAVAPGAAPIPRTATSLLVLMGLAVALIALQLVPLPPSLWAALPGRAPIAGGFDLLGVDRPWLPLSLAPASTLTASVALIPPFALILAMLRFDTTRVGWLAAALLIATFASILLGALQLTGGTGWYPYRYSAFGAATGFFANSNHMATLLLVAMPFLAAIAIDGWDRAANVRMKSFVVAVALGCALLLAIGVLLNGALAVQLLGLPVALASLALFLRRVPTRIRRRLIIAAGVVLVAAALVAVLARDLLLAANDQSLATRQIIWADSFRMAGDHLLPGAGIGSYEQLYRLYESFLGIGTTYINNAHNDYLELLIEAGLAGMLLLLGFLIWWSRRAWQIVTSSVEEPYRCAAVIASATILLHSFVDYPLRTAAIAAVMAVSVALMALPWTRRRTDQPADLRPARHLAA